MNLIKSIAKRTEKIRYKVISLIIKYITPSLYDKIVLIIRNDWAVIPRPSIIVMKEIFNQQFVIGAEIGVEKGINTKSILKELNIKKLYLIDVWFDYKEIQFKNRPQKENFELVSNEFKDDKRIEIIRDFSKNAINRIDNNSLDFVYIDANHLYKYVYQDICLWFKKVRLGGIIAGHDIFKHSGVLRAVKEFCSERNFSFNIDIPDWYFSKKVFS